MENSNWLNSLEDINTSNVSKFLELLEINLNNFTKICVSGNSFRVTTITTLKEVLNSRKIHSGAIIFSDYDKIITYKNRVIDSESLEFHLGCIKIVSEENNLKVGKNEALFLAALNFFREQKANIIMVEDAFDFIKDINYDYYLLDGYSDDKNIISYSKLDMKDIFLYKSELCSFSYNNLDYDVLNYGSFNALSYILGIYFINELYPEIKPKKIRNIVNDIKINYIYNRVNKNPRVIINYLASDSDLNESIGNIKRITSRIIITVSNIYDSNVDYVIKDVNEVKDIINSANINDIVYICFNKLIVKEVVNFFIN